MNPDAAASPHAVAPADGAPPRATVIVPCPDGPLLIRGPVELRTPSGELIPRRRRTVALCRCGATGIPPFCDGSHKAVGFQSAR
ncbi:CDGSH iron-sulfur domain-containing protein [Pengzhenrongella frigida]|uniref:CDGSH iron-sulfur domain-containing protein n=1 Tax=Pengzhenrongella frigida TaxID=1259133 RepID=A0A4Q5MYT1_9MICO|nr:CDGSH iron-sulfur domain-containing protein [Cellulomonas sp. HLT2-17]RYV50850.1 CDGSH iron-sulfur domain-containing protein [Cellulomonas sp. HLT2-17]